MIGIIAHSRKADAKGLGEALCAELDSRSAKYLLEETTAELMGRAGGRNERELAEKCDLLVVLGGDGTILRVVHRIWPASCPIFGINLGSLGFLTCLGPQEIARAVDSILAGDFIMSKRSLLFGEIAHSRGARKTFFALNDVVISRGEQSQLVKLQVIIDGELLTDYNADGLIVATPTGSTAYSLSAGGPILTPQSGAFVVTPICPHVLTNRSLVVSDASAIEVRPVVPEAQVFVSADGQKSEGMHRGDRLVIRKSPASLPLAMLPERSFSEVLRQKLKWSGSNV